jgi:peptide chain release factor 2
LSTTSENPCHCSGGIFDPDQAKARLTQLDREAEAPDFWSDSRRAQSLMRERQQLETALNAFDRLIRELDETLELLALGEEEGDETVVADAERVLARLRQEAHTREVEALLSGEADANDSYVEIHAGAGGTESQDWAQMLERMYVRWAETRDYKVEIIGEHFGEEAGIKSATILIKGMNAYGWLKTESGVHRLVRISPFDSNARRHTSFASVSVYPAIDDTIEIEIDEKDVRIDTYRSSGAGGQHVNTTDSAVRITHLPTGIVVQCQNERSQHKNRATAWGMLRARLYEAELKRREEEAEAQAAAKSDIGFGHQIRSYVLQPYQLVKDLRTGVESTNPSAVLDGEIDRFIEAALAERLDADAKVRQH